MLRTRILRMADSRYIVLEDYGTGGPATHAPGLRLRVENMAEIWVYSRFNRWVRSRRTTHVAYRYAHISLSLSPRSLNQTILKIISTLATKVIPTRGPRDPLSGEMPWASQKEGGSRAFVPPGRRRIPLPGWAGCID